MNHIIKFLICGFVTLWISTSCNYLDVDKYFDDTLPYDSIFSNKRNVERYMWNIATKFPDPGRLLSGSYTPGPLATDEGFAAFNTTQFRGMGYVLGELNPDNLRDMNTWSDMYKVIRRCNTIFQRMDEASDMTAADRFRITGYTRFMRAYAYYLIVMDLGPVVILGDEVLPNNNGSYNNHRATYDESVDYICNELEKASESLPLEVLINEFGRPTKGAAYGLIARLRLIQASPLFNGGDAAKSYYGNWKRSIDGVHYISQEYNEEKWAVAAAACERIMQMGYKLHTVPKRPDTPDLPSVVPSANFPNGAGDIDPYRSYSDIFTGEAISQKNPELIWAQMSYPVQEITQHSFNVSLMGGWNGMSLPQKVIDNYRMADGRTKDNSSEEYPYDDSKMTAPGSKVFSGYVLNGGINGMYANREMRFYASVGFSRRFWQANSTSDNNRKNLTITYDRSGNSGRYDGENITADYPTTGYVLTKFIHDNDAWKGDGATRIAKSFPTIRYAEILLSYAEALNWLTKPYTIKLGENSYTLARDVEAIAKAVNQVRFRAGLPPLTSTELADPQLLQTLLEKERMSEFLFENRRYYDVRRWGIYEDTEREPIRGMDIDSDEPEYYRIKIVDHSRVRNRIVHRKMVFLPLSRSEVRKVKDLDQNYGWAD